MCRRRSLKINASKTKVMMLNGEYEIRAERMQLEHMSEFKYLGCVLNESGTDEAECCRKAESGRKARGTIRSLVNARGL